MFTKFWDMILIKMNRVFILLFIQTANNNIVFKKFNFKNTLKNH